MKRLNSPCFDEMALFDACVFEMDDGLERNHLEENRGHLKDACIQFNEATNDKRWCDLPRARHGHHEDIVLGNLTKGQLKSLYETNVVKSKGEARDIYDQIYASAHGRCPYCAEIGEVETLDHYLPKAYFPSYAVLPLNLIPACNKCNKGSGQAFPAEAAQQPLNPYLDEDHFFQQRWVRAVVRQTDPIEVLFGVEPPENWNQTDKARVQKYFIDFKLQDRFSKQVPGELGPLLSQRRRTLSCLSEDIFREHLSVVAGDPSLLLNGWKRTLYLGLCESDWFCQFNFGRQ